MHCSNQKIFLCTQLINLQIYTTWSMKKPDNFDKDPSVGH